MGQIFRDKLFKIDSPFIKDVRGKGLLNAIEIVSENNAAWEICLKLMERGLLAKPTHGNIIRFAPPLVINESEMLECTSIIIETILSYKY